MTLSLSMGTKPDGLEIKTWNADTVYLGDYEISLIDFLYAAKYVLTNVDLKPNDPRLKFVEYMKSMKAIDGYSPGGKRLESDVSLSPMTLSQRQKEK